MKKILYSIMALGLLFASCQKNETEGVGAGDNRLLINASIGESNSLTRTNPIDEDETKRTSFNIDDEICAYRLPITEKEEIYMLTENGWVSDNYLLWNSEQELLAFYYPTDYLIRLKSGNYNIPDQSTIEKIAKADAMMAEGSYNKPAPGEALDVVFERISARVIVNIAGFNDEFDDAANQKVESVSLNAKNKSGFVNIKPYTADNGGIGSRYYALLDNDGSYLDETFIELVVNGNTYEVKGIPALVQGKSYTYNVTIGKNRAYISSVVVEDWGTGHIIEQDAEEILPEVGDYYYNDGEISKELIAGRDDSEIKGIVVWTDPIEPNHGKIISVNFNETCAWSTEVKKTTAVDAYDGLINMMQIYSSSSIDMLLYPAFNKVHALNDPNTVAYGDYEHSKNMWYLPAINELDDLVKNIDVINDAYSKIYGGDILHGIVWSSTEINDKEAMCKLFFGEMLATTILKSDEHRVLPFMAY